MLLILAVQYNLLWAYDDEVHRKINEETVKASQLDLILKDNLGMDNGVDTVLAKLIVNGNPIETVLQWVSYGGEAEDFGMPWDIKPLSTRAFNHFHDPLKDWDNAGLDHILNLAYKGRYWRDPVSPILWGLDPGRQDFEFNITGDWSWGKAREYYYSALTKLTEEERNQDLAYCFRALGQVMHLVQDASVPLHTRNDVHIFPISTKWPFIYLPWTYETYVKENLETLVVTGFFEPRPPAQILLTDPQPQSQPTDYSHLPSITGLFDRNQYNGDSIPVDNDVIGLAEYSNANFLTEDTMWTYPHPGLADTNYNYVNWLNPEPVIAEDGKTDNRIYIRKTQGEPIEHLAAIDYYTLEYYDYVDIIYSPFELDNKCWEDYASKLIPRAVGYSAELLDYFFRGTIEISLSDDGVYALTDKDPSITDTNDSKYIEDPTAEGFDNIQLLARNTTPNGEEMSGGTVNLVIKFRVAQDDQFQTNPPVPPSEFHYIVKEIPDITIPRDTSVLLDFDLSENPIPLWATDISLYLVYKGILGNEEVAVAVGLKDISEPTPIDYFNVMDKICLNDQLFDSGTPPAIAFVDTDSNGIADPDEWDVYPHDAENIHIRFSPSTNPQDATPESSASNNYEMTIISPGEHFRLFILSDYEFSRSTYVEYREIVSEDQCHLFHGSFPRPAHSMSAIKNQYELVDPVYCGGNEPCYIRVPIDYHITRGIDSFVSILFDNAPYPPGSICTYEQ